MLGRTGVKFCPLLPQNFFQNFNHLFGETLNRLQCYTLVICGCSGEEPFLNAVMKVFNADRSADPSTYKDLAAQCVPAFLDMVMANMKEDYRFERGILALCSVPFASNLPIKLDKNS